MRRRNQFLLAVVLVAGILDGTAQLRVLPAAAESGPAQKANADASREPAGSADKQSMSAARTAREEKAIQDARRLQLSEKEATLAAKEQELKKLAAKLEAQVKALDDSKRRLDDSLKAQKKVQDDKRKKMMTLIKKMRPEQAGKFMDKMDEPMVISMLDQMDVKTVLKLMPYLNQPRVQKWVIDNLKGA